MVDGLNDCHMLLERPWQFDAGVKYDGHDNTYQLVKDMTKYKLTPLQKCNGTKPLQEGRLSIIDYLYEAKAGLQRVPWSAWFGSEGKLEGRRVTEWGASPTEVRSILNELHDVLLKRFSRGLQPCVTSQHCSYIPNEFAELTILLHKSSGGWDFSKDGGELDAEGAPEEIFGRNGVLA